MASLKRRIPSTFPIEAVRSPIHFIANHARPLFQSDVLTGYKVDHKDPATGGVLLLSSLGSTDTAFVDGLLDQIQAATRSGSSVNLQRYNFTLSIVQGLEPRDHTEAMLAAQMAAIHSQAVTVMGNLRNAELLNQFEAYERAATKLMRTFTSQMEALKRYRTTGQTVTVEHVHVHAGGQAVVGNVNGGGASTPKAEPTP